MIHASSPGQRFGKYEILGEIGRGGFGAVYKARDTVLSRIVALKLLAPHLLWDPTFVQRFQQEAQAAANLRHPNIVVIYELGEEQSARYIAMEYLPGMPLDKLLADGPLPLEHVCTIIAQIASALDYAHAQGLVHRDVKASNIIVDEHDHATLTDFGLVKAASGSSLSSAGQIIGTPEYMSPEQAEGKPADARSDMYSLGIVLFQMLTGKVPFSGESSVAVLHKQVYEALPSLCALRPDLPPATETAVNKALAKDPVQRWQTAGEMSAALAEAAQKLQGKHTEPDVAKDGAAQPPKPPRPAMPWQVVPRWLRVAGLIAAIALAVVIVSNLGPHGGTVPATPTRTPVVAATVTATTIIAPATATPEPPTQTPVPPTATSVPSTPVPAVTAIPVTPAPPTAAQTTVPSQTATPQQAATPAGEGKGASTAAVSADPTSLRVTGDLSDAHGNSQCLNVSGQDGQLLWSKCCIPPVPEGGAQYTGCKIEKYVANAHASMVAVYVGAFTYLNTGPQWLWARTNGFTAVLFASGVDWFFGPPNDGNPKTEELVWNSQGTRVAYYAKNDLHVADVPSHQQMDVTANPGDDYGVTWVSADRLEYCQERDGKYETYAVNWDGTSRQKVRDDCPVRR